MEKPLSMTNIANTNRNFQKLVFQGILIYEFCKKDSLVMKSSTERIDGKQQ